MGKFQFWLPTKLTRIQQRAVDSTEPIVITGVPGTGKTVVAIKRILNSENGIIFTYGKLLKKTIEEKLNNSNKPVDNIHNWLWNIQGGDNKQYLEDFVSDENIKTNIEKLKKRDIHFDEILIDEGQDLPPNIYKLLIALSNTIIVGADDAQQINNREHAITEKEILKLLSNHKHIELDEVFRSAYELYKFAIQFVPYNARAHDERLLERLKRKNSGADKPYVYLENNLNNMYETIKDIIDENPSDNIGILYEKIHHINETAKVLSQNFELSTYHSIQRVVPSELKNIIITTFKSAKGIEFDIVIIPYLPDGAQNIEEEYYVGVTRAKNQVFFIAINNIPNIMSHFDENTYELVDNRG